MSRIPIEYALCQYQSNAVSLAVKSHRSEGGGNPELVVNQNAYETTFRLENLTRGGAEIIAGQARTNHIDFYILQRERETVVSALPAPIGTRDPSLLLPPLDASGSERRGGKRLQDPTPLFRLQLLSAVVNGGTRDRFSAVGDEPQLHIDYEIGPARIYGIEMPEIHFGITAEFWSESSNLDDNDWCHIEMSNECYATIFGELQLLT